MAKRKSLNKRYSRYSRGSGGSDVLNPDTNILGDEYPYWWKNLENNTIYRLSTDSTNFNQTSRRLNSNTSIRTSNEPDNDWWKNLEGTPRTLRSLKRNDLSKEDATTDGAPEMSESEEEGKIAKKKPPLRSEAKKNDGNAFLSVLNDSRVLLVPLEKDPAVLRSSFAQKCFPPTEPISSESSFNGSSGIVAKPKSKILRKEQSDRNASAFEGDKPAETPSKRKSLRNLLPTNKRFSNPAGSSVIASSTDPKEAQNSMNENDHDLSNFSLPKATSTLLDNSILFHQTANAENSNSDTEPIVMKPKSKLLRRHNRDTRKNLFENILLENKIDEDEDEPLPNASAVVDESAEEPEPRIEVDETTEEPVPRIVEDESKLVDASASKKLRPTGKTSVHDPASDSSDASCALEPAKPKSKFLREARRSHRENFFQRILDESDLSITNVSKEGESMSQKDKSASTARRRSAASADSNTGFEDMQLRLSNSSNASDVDIIRPGDGNGPRTASSQPQDPLSTAGRTSREGNASRERTQPSATRSDEEQCDKDSDVTLIIPESVPESLSGSLGSKVPSDIVLMQPEVPATEHSQIGSVQIKDSAAPNRSRSAQKIVAEDARNGQRTVNSQDRSSPAISREASTEYHEETPSRRGSSLGRLRKRSVSRAGSASEMDKSFETPRTQGKRSIPARQRISATEIDEQTRELENTTPRRSKRSQVTRRTSETVQTPKRDTVVAKRSVSQTVRETETEAVGSPSRKQSKRASRPQEHALTPVEENDPAETIEDVPLRPSQRSSRTRKGAPFGSANESEIESSQPPANRQSKRASRVQEASASVREEKAAKIEDVPPRPSRRPSRTRKGAPFGSANESEIESSQPPANRQSKRASRVQDASASVREEEPAKIEDVAPRPSRRPSRTREGAPFGSANESEIESSQPPAKTQSKRASKVQEQVSTSVREEEPAKMEDVAPRPSQKSSITRKGAPFGSANKSEIESSQSPANKQSKRASRGQEEASASVREEEAAKIADVAPRRSRRPSRRTREADSLSFVSESEIGGRSPAKSQRAGASKALDRVASSPAKDSETASTPRSRRSSRTRRNMAAGESEAENNSIVRTRKRRSRATKTSVPRIASGSETDVVKSPLRKRKSSSLEQTAPTAATESERNDAMRAESTARKRSQRPSKIPPASASETETEGGRSTAVNRSKTQRPMEPEEAEGTAPTASRRLGGARKGSALFPDVDSDGPTEEQMAANEQTEPGDTVPRPSRTRKEDSKAEDVRSSSTEQSKRSSGGFSKRRSEPRRISSDSESEALESPTKRRNEGADRSERQTIASSVVAAGNDPLEADGPRQTRRQSNPRRVTSLLSPSDLEESHVESPTRNRSERTHRSEKQSVTIDAASTGRRRSQWQSSVREATRLHFTTESNSEEDGSDSPDDQPARAEYSAQSRSRRLSSNVELLRNESETEDDPSAAKSQSERGRRPQIRVVSIDSGGKDASSVLSSRFVAETFVETQARDPGEAERRSTPDKRNDGGSAVQSPSAMRTREAESEKFRRPSSTSLNARSLVSGRRPTLSRVGRSEETEEEEEEGERAEVDGARKQVFAATQLESSTRSTQERSATASNREKQSFKQRGRSGSKVEGNMDAKIGGELDRRSSARAATTRDGLPSRKKRSGLSAGSIPRQDTSLESVGVGVGVGVDRSRNVGFASPSREPSRPGPSGRSGWLRPLSLNRLGTAAERDERLEGREIQSNTVLGRSSSVKATGSGKAKSPTAPRASEKSQRTIRDFFEARTGATSASQGLSNVETVQEIRKKLEEIKKREIEGANETRKLAAASEKNRFGKGSRPRAKQQNSVPRKARMAYLVNGRVYKQPRLPRPMRWVTDRLYRYLWKQMQPKYDLETRVQSEKFVRRLSEVASVIAKRKTYLSYKNELHSLMKEMARHQIIRSRNDFYHFCHDFLPYELRIKMVPILQPGNQTNVPYDPNKLHEPLLSP